MIPLLPILAAALTAAEEAGAHGGPDMMAPDPTLTYATWITFFIFVAILAKFGWTPLVKSLDEREAAVADHVRRAEHARKEAEELLESYNQKLASAKAETDAMIVQARARGEEVVQRMTADAKQQAESIAKKAQESIEAERLRAVTELRQIVAEASVSLAGKILHEELTPARHAKLIDETVAGIAAKK